MNHTLSNLSNYSTLNKYLKEFDANFEIKKKNIERDNTL